ncbi:alpha/beta-hydrolase [Meredithblackwellia eburnea MCA 4105]
MSCDDCFKGSLHTGTPRGTFETIGGVRTYVVLPKGDYDKSVATTFWGDVFGLYDNALLVCDAFADAGLATYAPDFFEGDPVPQEVMNKVKDFEFDSKAWNVKHNQPDIRKRILDPFMSALRNELKITKLGAHGYCFGGRYVFDFCFENAIEAGQTSHPSRCDIPDLHKLLETSKIPLLINACETDETWPKHKQEAAIEILGDGKYKPGFKQNYYPGCTHGFGTRADLDDPKQVFGKENSLEETVAWFKKYLI